MESMELRILLGPVIIGKNDVEEMVKIVILERKQFNKSIKAVQIII